MDHVILLDKLSLYGASSHSLSLTGFGHVYLIEDNEFSLT